MFKLLERMPGEEWQERDTSAKACARRLGMELPDNGQRRYEGILAGQDRLTLDHMLLFAQAGVADPGPFAQCLVRN